jgi:hypothetical protein
MSLKILIIPFLIIMSLILSIGFIKADIVVLLDKMNELEARKTERDEVDKIQNRIVSMKGELAAESEKVGLLGDYLPGFSDQERAIDAINYLASRTGLLLTSVDVTEVKSAIIAVEPEIVVDPLGLAPTLPDGTPIPQPKKFVPEKYVVTVNAIGTYPSAREYLTQISRSSRFVRVKAIDIKVFEIGGAAEGVLASGASDLLELTVTGEFDYLRTVQIDNAMTYPYIFASETGLRKSVASVAEIMDALKADIPVLTLPADIGRENPFIK